MQDMQTQALSEPDVLYRPVITREALIRDGKITVLDSGPRHGEVLAVRSSGEHGMPGGLFLSFAREVQLDDLETSSTIIPCVSIKLFLDGAIDATMDGMSLPMPSRKGAGGWNPAGVIVSHGRRAHFHRKARKGEHLTKVIIDVPHDWIRARLGDSSMTDGLNALLEEDLALWKWEPGGRAIYLAEQLFEIAAAKPPFASLLFESCALGIVWEALSATYGLDQPAGAVDEEQVSALPDTLSAVERRRLLAMARHIDLHRDETHTPEGLAARLGISPSTLQRLVRKAHGCSLTEYLRNSTLEEARKSLLLGKQSIAEIAFRAGYNNQSNFANAFRKKFGVTPSYLRRTTAKP